MSDPDGYVPHPRSALATGMDEAEQAVFDAIVNTGSAGWQRNNGWCRPGNAQSSEGSARMKAILAVQALRAKGMLP